MEIGYVQLPPPYREARYPGYFWNVDDKRLYSIKSGWLKLLKLQNRRHKARHPKTPYYQVSVKGQQRYILALECPVTQLREMKQIPEWSDHDIYY